MFQRPPDVHNVQIAIIFRLFSKEQQKVVTKETWL